MIVKTGGKALLCLAGAVMAPAVLSADEAAAHPATIVLPPGQAVLLRGTATARQVAGGETVERRFDVAALVFPGAGPRGETRVFAVRTLVPVGSDDPPLVTFDEIAITQMDAARVDIEDPAPELESGALKVELHFPLEPLPPFPVPAPGAESRGEAEVAAAHPHLARGAFVTATRAEAGTLEVTRVLAPGARPEFLFDGSPAVLTGWREIHSADLKTGAPRRIEKEASLEVKSEDGPVRLEKKLAIEVVSPLEPVPSATLERRLRDLDAACRSLAPAAAIARHVEELRTGLPGGPYLEVAALAASRRLAAYTELFESDAGKKLASLLGKPAPDFTLEGLDGKKVNFREATRGKAALLTFWGVG